jgi:hypothetical protein
MPESDTITSKHVAQYLLHCLVYEPVSYISTIIKVNEDERANELIP